MATHNYTAGLRNVGSYQIAGHPFITGSTNLDNNKVHMIEFPYVCRSFTVVNISTPSTAELRVHFQSGSTTAVTGPGDSNAQTIADTGDVIAGNHFIYVGPGSGSVTMNVRCSKIYISNGSGTNDIHYQVFAELTTIPTGSMYKLTGSGITEIYTE